MAQAVDELWTVALNTPHVDAEALAGAIEAAVQNQTDVDYRTRLLVRDSVTALESHWGKQRFRSWLENSPQREQIDKICAAARSEASKDHHDRGFPTLARRVVDVTKPESILQFFRELSTHVRTPTRIAIGGSISLILDQYLARRTDDIDVVNEVPADLRTQHDVLDDLAKRFGLRLSHFQSHYLPGGWEQRVHSIESFGQLQVVLIDVYDVFVGKLFSVRSKDRDDLRAVLPKLDRDTLVRRLKESSASLRSDPRLLEAAQKNWFILFGEDLPN